MVGGGEDLAEKDQELGTSGNGEPLMVSQQWRCQSHLSFRMKNLTAEYRMKAGEHLEASAVIQ